MELTHSVPNVDSHTIVKTHGYWTCTDNAELIDILCGNTAFIFGYSDEDIFRSMIDTQRTVGFLKGQSNESCAANDLLISTLCKIGNFASVSWAVSGSDGVELAISANDRYWQAQKLHKPSVVVFDPNYHGTTYLPKIFRGQYTAQDRAISVPANDLVALENVLATNDKIGAILMESCPWIGGIKPWSQSWWESVRALCDKYNINFIVDDVFGGVGKLGHVFSHQRYNVQPDIVVLGKSLTAGYSPLSCACVNQRITDIVKHNWDYGHTWSPNMGGIGAALAVMKKFDPNTVVSIEHRLSVMGNLLKEAGLIKSYTNIGLLMQIDLVDIYPADFLLKHNLNGFANDYAVKICAPIIADDDYFIELYLRLQHALSNK